MTITDIEGDEVPAEGVANRDTPPEEAPDVPEDRGNDTSETFPRSYVEKLRNENARYRQRAGEADAYAQRLHTELVRATGKLADPADLEFDQDHLDDPDTLAAAVEDLLARKPHLTSRRPMGDIGQGERGSASGQVSLLGMLKERV